MTIGKGTALALGLAGAVAFGIWIGPYVYDRGDTPRGPVAEATVPATEAAPAVTTRTQRAPAQERFAVIPASSPELHRRLKPVLTAGTNLDVAARGFRDGEQFASVAHAARNTGVPFMVLKHRVLEERMSLAAAIRDLKPDVDAAREANRARILARADIAAIAT